jgi:hypothetical protein
MSAPEHLIDSLVANYIHQKELLLEAAGVAGVLNRERLSDLMRPRIERMAELVQDWNVSPEVLMAACFEQARKNRHPDGPMPNMLFSEKYLTRSLSEFLQVPYEAVVQRKSMDAYLKRCDWDYEQTKKTLDTAGVTDLVTASTFPVEYRYLMAITRFDMESACYLAPELLQQMAADRRTSAWLEHRGVKYERVAAQFNKWRKQHNV